LRRYRKESDLAKDVMAFLNHGRHGTWATRIESPSCGRGIPDIWFTSRGEAGWIELKVARQPFEGTSSGILWKPAQTIWMWNAYIHGTSCYTLAAFHDCYVRLLMDRRYKYGEPLINYTQGETLEEVFYG